MRLEKVETCEIPNHHSFVNLVTIPPTRYGRLLVVAFAGKEKSSSKNKYVYKCICDCGNFTYVRNSHLSGGNIISCGCYLIEVNQTHKSSNTSEYTAWKHMKERCDNTKCARYNDYGGRGVTYCERWTKFENFIEDMGLKPDKNLSLERLDNEGNYCKENCKWATWLEQGNNKRWNVYVEYNGEKYSISQLAKKFNISRSTLNYRLEKGQLIEDIINELTGE